MTEMPGSIAQEALPGWSAAAVGTMTRTAAGRRFVAAARPATGAMALAFASPGLFPLALEPLAFGP